VYYQNTSQKKPASEGAFDSMEMSDQILKIREQGVTLSMFVVQVLGSFKCLGKGKLH